MNSSLLKKMLMNEHKIRESIKIPDILQDALPYQLNFIKDPARRKAVCSTRRSAKSWCIVLYLISEALKTENGIFAFLTLTNDSAKRIVKPILREISDKYNLNLKIDSDMEIKFSNGSIIYLVGLDSTSKQMGRLRGNKYDLACIDECQGFTQDLREVIENVLDIALAQSKSTLVMAGTPGNDMSTHYWWMVNRPDSEEHQWKKFFFNWRENTSLDVKSNMKVCDCIQEELDLKISRNPLIINTPAFRQEWLGEWVVETSARVYKSSKINYIKDLPLNFLKKPTYILSLDLGYYDATAFVIGAYNKRIDNNFYILESFKKSKLTITEVAEIIKELKKKYFFSHHIVDAANTQAVEEMRQQHSLPLKAAEKLGKEAHIALINSDFITNNCKIIESANKDLIQELETLIWDQKALLQGKHKENASKANHLCDALLYSHHASRHYWYASEEAPLTFEERVEESIEKQFIQKNKLKQIRTPWWHNVED